MSKYAYITLATNEEYLKEAYLLQISLRRVKCEYPLIVMIPKYLEDNNLCNKFDIVKIVTYYRFPIKRIEDTKYRDTLSKFNAWEMTDYDKLLYVDADMFVMKNLDYVFDMYKDYEFITMSKGQTYTAGGVMFITPSSYKLKDILDFVLKNNDEQLRWVDEEIIMRCIYKNEWNNKNYGYKFNTWFNLDERYDNIPLEILHFRRFLQSCELLEEYYNKFIDLTDIEINSLYCIFNNFQNVMWHALRLLFKE